MANGKQTLLMLTSDRSINNSLKLQYIRYHLTFLIKLKLTPQTIKTNKINNLKNTEM